MPSGYMESVMWRGSDQSVRDSSPFRNIFSLGAGCVLSSSGGKFGGGYLQGDGTVAAMASTQYNGRFNPGTADFFLSAWAQPEGVNWNTSRQSVIGRGTSGNQSFSFGFRPNLEGLYYYQTTSGSSTTETVLDAPYAFTPGQWYHIACSRSGGTVRLFVDGVQIGSISAPSTFVNTADTTPLLVGGYGVSGFTYPFKGKLNDVYMVVGDAMYTANFTPPATYLTPQTVLAILNGKRWTEIKGALRSSTTIKSITRDCPRTRDVDHFGPYKITGTVKEFGVPTDFPLKRRVLLLREPGALPIRQTWSDSVTGAYTFDKLSNQHKYTVVAYDYQMLYRAVCADMQSPEPM